MEIKIQPVTDEIRFGSLPPTAITRLSEPVLNNLTSVLPEESLNEPGQFISHSNKTLMKHLWWIIPITLVTGATIGIIIYKRRQKNKQILTKRNLIGGV